MRKLLVGALMIVVSLVGVLVLSIFVQTEETRPQSSFNPNTWPKATDEFSVGGPSTPHGEKVRSAKPN
jgi:hypothetical protein